MKKIISIMLSLMLIFTQFAMVGFAADTATLAMNSVEAEAGENIELFVSIADNGVAIKNYSLSGFAYDADALEFVGGEALAIGTPMINNWDGSKFALAATYMSALTPCVGNILKLTFKVNDNAASGDYSISFATAKINSVVVDSVTSVITVTGSALPPVVDVTGITLDKTSETVTEGDKITLVATVTPDDATDPSVTWRTSDGKVATVVDGVVTAVAPGTATITAIAGGKEATCEITVIAKVIPVAGIALDKSTAEVTEGDKVTLVATVTPDDATDKTVTWETSDATIATVADGVVTTLKAGEVTITAKAGDKSATCVITVNAKAPAAAPALSATTGLEAEAGESVDIYIAIADNGVAIKNYSLSGLTFDADALTLVGGEALAIGAPMINNWDGSKYALAATYMTGLTPCVGNILKLTFKVNDGAKAGEYPVSFATAKINSAVVESVTSVITVKAAAVVEVSGITLDKETAKVTEGDEVKLVATVTPDNATDKTVTWETSDATIATVVDGVVTTLKAGEVTITAKAGNFSATCVITVDAKVIPVAGIALDKETAEVTEGDEVKLVATVTPDDATDKTVTWETSDAEVATVVDGVVTTLKAGTVTITAKAGDKEATCVITVNAKVIPVTSITLDKATATLEVSKDLTLVATVEPADATDKTVTWETSDATIATVVDGKVVALKEGTVTITAKAGDKEATCVITVERLTGDINGDGAVALDDAILLFNYSMAPDLFPVNYEKEMDLNGDGAVSLSDAILLFNFSVAPEIFALN